MNASSKTQETFLPVDRATALACSPRPRLAESDTMGSNGSCFVWMWQVLLFRLYHLCFGDSKGYCYGSCVGVGLGSGSG